MDKNIWKFILKQLKSVAYASAGGTILIGGATVDIVDADAITILYMIIAAVGFNVFKELTKNKINGKNDS